MTKDQAIQCAYNLGIWLSFAYKRNRDINPMLPDKVDQKLIKNIERITKLLRKSYKKEHQKDVKDA